MDRRFGRLTAEGGSGIFAVASMIALMLLMVLRSQAIAGHAPAAAAERAWKAHLEGVGVLRIFEERWMARRLEAGGALR